MIYLYALAEQFDSSLDPPLGIENQGVYQVNLGSFAPILSTLFAEGEVSKREVNLSKEAIYQHENIVEFFMNYGTILPVCFNTVFDNKEELIHTLNRYRLEIETNLLKVSGCVEMGVKALAKEDKEKKDYTESSLNDVQNIQGELSKAKKYILDKFLSHKEAFYLQEKYKAKGKVIYGLLKEFAKQGTMFPITATSCMILNSAFLVPKDSIVNFKENFNKIKVDHKEFAFLLSGPWPPYSFVDFQIEKGEVQIREGVK